MEKISIFNYEAYYLDYLEGNLNEEDTALLLAFLEANPDLKLEDEDIEVSLEPELGILDARSKGALFQHGEEDAVSLENIEFFMIAAQEGTLDAAKKAEVLAFLNAHPTLQGDWKIYQHTTLEADLSVRYADKDGLKQKTRVLWPYISVAAAASVAALIMLWPVAGTQDLENELGYVAGNVRNGAASTFFVGGTHTQGNGTGVGQDVVHTVQYADQTHVLAQSGHNAQQTGNPRQKPVNHLDYRPAGNVPAVFSNLELQPIAKTVYATQDPQGNPNASLTTTSDMAFARNLEMHNPIEPITKFVSDKTNTDIDFRQSDKGTDGKKGFYLKIGKLEISRKRH